MIIRSNVAAWCESYLTAVVLWEQDLPVLNVCLKRMEEKWSVEKLDGSNWITWKFQVRHLMMAKGLWTFVDESAVLAGDASEEVREKFKAEQQKAFSTIVMSLSSSLLYLITLCELPKDAWDTLKKHFERDTLANKLFLKKQYFRKEMSEGMHTPINVHLKEMKMFG